MQKGFSMGYIFVNSGQRRRKKNIGIGRGQVSLAPNSGARCLTIGEVAMLSKILIGFPRQITTLHCVYSLKCSKIYH